MLPILWSESAEILMPADISESPNEQNARREIVLKQRGCARKNLTGSAAGRILLDAVARVSRGQDGGPVPGLDVVVQILSGMLPEIDAVARTAPAERARANLWFGEPCVPLASAIASASLKDLRAIPSHLFQTAVARLGQQPAPVAGSASAADWAGVDIEHQGASAGDQAGSEPWPPPAWSTGGGNGVDVDGAPPAVRTEDPPVRTDDSADPVPVPWAPRPVWAERPAGAEPAAVQPLTGELDDAMAEMPQEAVPMAPSPSDHDEEDDPLLRESPPTPRIGAGGVPAPTGRSDAIRRLAEELHSTPASAIPAIPMPAPPLSPPDAGSGGAGEGDGVPGPGLRAPRRSWFRRAEGRAQGTAGQTGNTDAAQSPSGGPDGHRRDPRILVLMAVVVAVALVFVVWPYFSARPGSPQSAALAGSAGSAGQPAAAVLDQLAAAAASPRRSSLPPGYSADAAVRTPPEASGQVAGSPPEPDPGPDSPSAAPARPQRAGLPAMAVSPPAVRDPTEGPPPAGNPARAEVPAGTLLAEVLREDILTALRTELPQLLAEVQRPEAGSARGIEALTAEVARLQAQIAELRQQQVQQVEQLVTTATDARSFGVSPRAHLGAIERDPVTGRHYVRVIPGESLADVALRTNVNIVLIQRLNPAAANLQPHSLLASGSLWIEPVHPANR